jgi:predicted extracellular nuclease
MLSMGFIWVQKAESANPGDVVINEIMQNPSAVSDTNGEWFELINTTGDPIDINGWTIQDTDSDSHVIDNGGPLIIPAAEFLVLARNADSSTNGGVPVDYEYGSDFFLANGADELILTDIAGTEINRVEWDGGPNFPDPNGASMALSDPALDNNIGANWCTAVTPFGDGDLGTPGSANDCEVSTPTPVVKIPQIQGKGHISPFVGQVVTTTGVVTAVAFDGFYVQDPEGDGESATSDGMFVFMGDFCDGCPAVGDEVQLTDRVDEFIPGGAGTGNLSTTDMAFPVIDVLSSGNLLPDPVVIGTGGRIAPNVVTISEDETPVNLQTDPGVFNPDVDGIDFYESLEGMLVTIEDAVAVSATRRFGSFSSELFTLTNDGANIAPSDARTARGGINLAADSDGYGDTNPERVQIQFDSSPTTTGTLYPFSAPEITVGDRLGDVTGVVGYSFGNFEVNAIAEVNIFPSELEGEVTALVGAKNHVTVASYNVLNLSPLPSDDNQRETLAAQIVDNLKSPDVIALQEIQDNNGSNSDNGLPDDVMDGVVDATLTLERLVEAIRDAGGPRYMFFNVDPEEGTSGGIPGGNIRNAFLYNADRVKLVDFVSLTPDVLGELGVSNTNAFDGTRDPLLGTFKFRGKEFKVINNHLTSRFGSTPIFGGPQLFVQAGETEREAQAKALNEVVNALIDAAKGNSKRASKAARVIVLGDLNTFEFTNDLTDILPGTGSDRVLTNLIDSIADDNVYTFNFEGNSQVLDHFFVSDNLLAGAKLDIVHVNVDYPRIDDTVGSDHEPLVGLFQLK